MKVQSKIKMYSKEEMAKYCKDHIDKYKVEPIVRAAFHEGLIKPVIAFVYLRIAQMEGVEEKITYSQIAQEANLSPSAITKYKQNELIGIKQKTYIQLLLKTRRRDWLNMCENNNFNEVLAEYVNKHKKRKIANGEGTNIQKEEYELNRETEITKDVCRKAYDELVASRVSGWDEVKQNKGVVITAEVIEKAETVKVKVKWHGEEEQIRILECSKDYMVHELVAKLRTIIGGLLSSSDCREKVYLLATGNRKICLAMEYIALGNEKVYLL